MKTTIIIILNTILVFSSCTKKTEKELPLSQLSTETKKGSADRDSSTKTEIEKDFLYNQHTLTDTYPYKDTVRIFQWNKIRGYLALVDSIQKTQTSWAILQNRKNKNGESPLVRTYKRNEYKRVSDTFGTERYQSVPLYLPTDTIIPKRYGLDGLLVRTEKDTTTEFVNIETIYFQGKWKVPSKYVKFIADSTIFTKVIMVDRTNQNISTFEKVKYKWLVRSMNPATTGLHKPPYMQPTPLGIFVIQENKSRMVYLVDGSSRKGGFAPYASRFSNGGYLHGVPVNLPHRALVEFSSSLGTIPHSHMCVRNATSHAKFIYDWAPVDKTLVVVFD